MTPLSADADRSTIGRGSPTDAGRYRTGSSTDADRSGIGRGSPGGADGLPAFQLARSAAVT